MTRVSAAPMGPSYHSLLAWNKAWDTGFVPRSPSERGPEIIDIPVRSRKLAQRLAALPELPMRRVALLEWMRERDPAEVIETLAVVLRRGRSGGPPFNI